jgi:hypothetical protein
MHLPLTRLTNSGENGVRHVRNKHDFSSVNMEVLDLFDL